jgi:prepilin-type N-terminal cleavage/methylation domain-containing protein/prepilin-type processing-associated H-X9-DG protein
LRIFSVANLARAETIQVIYRQAPVELSLVTPGFQRSSGRSIESDCVPLEAAQEAGQMQLVPREHVACRSTSTVGPGSQFQWRRGFTLVELLVVIAIIGILIALLLPAVQAAREAARRTQCKNHVKQLALGCLLHEDAHKFLPSGGWGDKWTGDPDRGYGESQPGSWLYNILTYIEEPALRDLGKGLTGNLSQWEPASRALHQSPVAIFHCPSRREARPYKSRWVTVHVQTWVATLAQTAGVVKTDYAANSGDSLSFASFDVYSEQLWQPLDYSSLDDPNPRRPPAWTDTNNPDKLIHFQTGVMYYRSELAMGRITDGTSNTYLLGEKYMDPVSYDATGLGGSDPTLAFGDNQGAYSGYEWDNHRVAWQPDSDDDVEVHQPRQDTPGYNPYRNPAFGSAHAGGYNAAFCDGSVRLISYTIDPLPHRWLANRLDGQSVSADEL